MQQKYGEKGLTVLGITKEPRRDTEEFMEETRGTYAYAYDTSGTFMSALGARAFPSAVLVDPSGTVVWSGHPAELSDGIVEKHLAGAFRQPIWTWPKSTAGVAKALQKKEFADALEELDELAGTEDGIADIRASVETLIANRMALLEKTYARGDFLGAHTQAERVKKEMKGLDEHCDRADELLGSMKKDKDAKRVMKLQKELLELKEERLNTRRGVEKLIEEVDELREEAEGTYAAQQAADFIESLRAMLR